MSALKELVNSLVEVIAGYHDLKTGSVSSIDKLQPINNLLTMPPDALNSTLAELISSAAKVQSARVNYLTYLAYIIKTIKPLVDHPEPLNESEISKITQVLYNLIINTQKLQTVYASDTYTLQYEDTSSAAYGFLPTLLYRYCVTKDLIQLYFSAYRYTLNPELNSESRIKDFIARMITEHQELCHAPLLRQEIDVFKQENAVLKQENAALKQENAALKQENAALAVKNSSLVKDYRGLTWTNNSLLQQLQVLQVRGREESAQPAEQPTTPLSPIYQDQGGLIGLFSHAHAFFRRKTQTAGSAPTGSALLAEENPDMESPHIVFRSQLGNSFDDPE